MGNMLDTPNDKLKGHAKEFKCGDKTLQYALTSMQGWRMNMEDAHIHLTMLPPNETLGYPEIPNISLFAVFDGHGGTHTSTYTADNLINFIQDNVLYKELVSITTTPNNASSSKSADNSLKVSSEVSPNTGGTSGSSESRLSHVLSKLVSEAFMRIDEVLSQNSNLAQKQTGTTAVLAFLTEEEIIVGNLGDSRMILVRNNDVHFNTEDHKPYLPKEEERIKSAGLSVFNRRINSDLALSRALGDFMYKGNKKLGPFHQAVSIEVDISVIKRSEDDDFMLIACDGVWDVMSNAEVADFVTAKLSSGMGLKQICDDLNRECLKSRDNISVFLISLKERPFIPGSDNEDEEEEEQVKSTSDNAHTINTTTKEASASKEDRKQGSPPPVTHS